MPRPGPRRKAIAVRLSEAGLEQLQTRATAEADGNQSEMIRRLLKYSMLKMPVGWGKQ